MGIWQPPQGRGQGMSDRFRTRRGVVVLAGALSAFAALPVAADSQIPGVDALEGAPAVPNAAVPNALERAVNQLEAIKRQGSAPHRSDPGNTRPTAPQRSVPAATPRPSSRSAVASGGAVRQRVTTSGTGNHAGVGASTGSSSRGSSSGTAAKAATSQARASDTAPAAQAVARPTAVSPGSHVQNDPSLPFTGSRPLDVMALGLLALAVGLAARWTLRRREHAQA
jgi:hypothetical protein